MARSATRHRRRGVDALIEPKEPKNDHSRSPLDLGKRDGSQSCIEEYARHNGHADLLRQRIDGAVGV
ncbi:MAG: DUF664 domain-containing protein [Acidimicrobiales bacterium]